MSKLSKFLKSPRVFFNDARKKSAVRQIDNMSREEQQRFGLVSKGEKPKRLNKKASGKKATSKGSGVNNGQQKYLQQLLDFVDVYPVNSLSDDQSIFWPYLRNELKVQLNVAWLKNISGSQNFNPYMTQLCRRENLPQYWRTALKADGAVEPDDIEIEKVDFLFFTNLNSVDHVEIDGVIHNRILDPVMERAVQCGYKCKKIELMKSAGPGLKKLPRYNVKPLKVIPPFEITTGRYQHLNVPEDFINICNKKISYVPLVDEKRLFEFYDWQMHMREMYVSLLKKFQPEAIFFHPYYYQTALIDAAASLGIKTVDVQHGLQVGFNRVFYANWNEMPSQGYSQLPDYFWVWGEKEKQNIEQQFQSKALVGGYPWLDKQLEFDDADYQELLTELPDGKKLALITLQLDGYISEKVLSYINQTVGDVVWLIRKHPKGSPVSGVVAGLSNVVSGRLVDEPLLAFILNKVDVHFSSGSSVIVEADYFGVYSYVYHAEGYQNFVEEIDQGLVGHVGDSPSEFIRLPYTDRSEPHPRLDAFSKRDFGEVFSELLES